MTLTPLPDAILVGVSGGIDSVALLHALVQTGRRPVVLHFDHGWRPESGEDALWVSDLAKRLDLKHVGGKMRPMKDHNESEARTERYAFFARTARELGIPDLVQAHHADDQVETFLMQFLRGSGSGGRGMDPIIQRDGLILHRPWLSVWKKEITEYAWKHRLKWREDSTNNDTKHRRNLVRKRVLPYLKKQMGDQVPGNLLRAAEISRAESEWLDGLCDEPANQLELSVEELRAVPLGQQRRTILRWLQFCEVKDISFTNVEAVRGLLENRSPAKINLSGGKFARRRAGKIFVE